MNFELMLTYDTPALRQTGSRNLMGPNIRSLPSIVAEKNVTKNVHICSMFIKINKIGKQEVGIRWVQKRFPQYGVPI
jgi:ribosomal protein L28